LANPQINSVRLLLVSRHLPALAPVCELGATRRWYWETAASGWEALEHVQSGAGSDLVVLDFSGKDREGLHALRWLRRIRPELPIVVLSHFEDADQRLEVTRLGAPEYLLWPIEGRQLEAVIARYLPASDNSEMETESVEIEQIAEDIFFVAASPSMRKLRLQAELLAQVNGPVLITGENGSGKESMARLIHKLSLRSGFRFLKINCKLLSADLLEQELFGSHLFVGNGGKPSQFELCDKGVLFLDEITAMPPNLQTRLLQVLQDGFFFKCGGQNSGSIDVRILAATSSIDPAQAQQRKLREDLYHQLSTFTVHMPPLRQRKNEIPLILGHFVKQLAKQYGLPARSISPTVLEACCSYAWPGNIRELENFAKCYAVTGDDNLVVAELGPNLPASDPGLCSAPQSKLVQSSESIDASEPQVSGLKSLAQSAKGVAERRAIADALSRTHWNRKAAAQLLEVSYRTLLYKIERYGMRPPVAPFNAAT
jgi:two-component system, NtrC family, response regulator AtoC